jgi:signal transduction histidine kinase
MLGKVGKINVPMKKKPALTLAGRVKSRMRNDMLRLKSQKLLTANRLLKREIVQRQKAELALKKSELHQKELLLQSKKMQEQLRYLSHQLLMEQEEQRKKISRELHDEISQVLAGINLYLADLKIEAVINTKGLSKKIGRAQRLVQKSVKIIHRFCQQSPTRDSR